MTTNLLAREKSPYLLQHKDNPVAWRPWGQEAFAEARRLNRPVFLSIGYSTCHWCHVMAHESFENAETAELMNESFINIKVDREERPDVDRMYMAFVQATTGGGGWPMSVWLTPEGKPFFGGTYFPPRDMYGRAGFPNIIRQIQRLWTENPAAVEQEGSRMMQALDSLARPGMPTNSLPGRDALDEAFERFATSFDSVDGGFGGAPKFPRPAVFNFLLRYSTLAENERGGRAREMVLHTLHKMAAGGMYDHLGGGFHRYSVDATWHVPHFEKMLYDQAQAAVSYLEAWQLTKEDFFARIVRETLDYVLREMTHAGGAFFSAEDADSLLSHEGKEHAEGAFYVWTEGEILEVLGLEDGEKFCRHYGVKEEGNVAPENDPHGEFTGRNILIEREPAVEGDEELAISRTKLFARRAHRPRPHLDDKILTAWNGLMISAFAKAGAALQEERYLAAAKKAARFVLEELQKDGQLLRSWRDGASDIAAFAEDYAFFIQGLLDLHEATQETGFLKRAEELQRTQDENFRDEEGGSYFSSRADDPLLPIRMKEDYDGAEPSANSISALNLLRMARIFHRDEWEEYARGIIAAHREQIEQAATAVPQMLVALDLALSPPAQHVIAASKEDSGAEWLRKEHETFLPRRVLLLSRGDASDETLPQEVREMKAAAGKPALYICEDFTCRAPLTEPGEIKLTAKGIIPASPESR